jgi:hypothetical protein
MTTTTAERKAKIETPGLIGIRDPIEDGTPNEETLKAFRDIEEKRDLLGPYATAEEMFRDFGIEC